jgi:hypothetical protein
MPGAPAGFNARTQRRGDAGRANAGVTGDGGSHGVRSVPGEPRGAFGCVGGGERFCGHLWGCVKKRIAYCVLRIRQASLPGFDSGGLRRLQRGGAEFLQGQGLGEFFHDSQAEGGLGGSREGDGAISLVDAD